MADHAYSVRSGVAIRPKAQSSERENSMVESDRNREESPLYPVAPLGIIALEGAEELANLIDHHIWCRRHRIGENDPDYMRISVSQRDSFLVSTRIVRFANGEAKALIEETVRGYDVYVITDVGNYSRTFKMFDLDCPMSPDDHFQNLKRTISAIGGKAYRLTVIMPMLYEGRQHERQTRESLDCALALQELEHLGVKNIITFDAHDPRVQNAIPLGGFETLYPTYQMLKALFEREKDLRLDTDHMIVISPDEGAMKRSLYYASMLGVDVGVYYKRRDYTRVVDGQNPIIQHEFLGRDEDVAGKDALLCDDLLSSGGSLLDIAEDLKARGANRIFVAVTFALFVSGLDKYKAAYEQGLISRVYATNLTYRRPELSQMPWFVEVDMSSFAAYLVDMLNHNGSISPLFDPTAKIDGLLRSYQIR